MLEEICREQMNLLTHNIHRQAELILQSSSSHLCHWGIAWNKILVDSAHLYLQDVTVHFNTKLYDGKKKLQKLHAQAMLDQEKIQEYNYNLRDNIIVEFISHN